jgi:molybdopterin-guanine dinucleotide biosynthesis protein A
MILDAVVLAGGRSSRLGGEPKAGLVIEGRTLLASTVDATSVARQTVIVGDALVRGALHARESPVFGGPAAGIAAGLVVLTAADTIPSEFVLVLACDMPGVAAAIPVLLAAARSARDGVIAVDSTGRAQYLAGVYRTRSLETAVRFHQSKLTNLSMRALLADLALISTAVPARSTDDIDTWSDAARYGIAARATTESA